jgi:negative regulator of flagellin synthesis FlgM
MKISDLPQETAIQYIQQNAKASPGEKAQASPAVKTPNPAEDRVDLSSESRDMQKINQVLAATPDVRVEKVDALRKLVESGQYDVKSDSLAGKMIKDFLSEMNQ